MEKKIKDEEEKEKCIKKAIKRKSVAQQRKAHALEVAAKINEIKQNTIEEIEQQQEKHKKKLKQQKMAFARRKLTKMRELAQIKMDMTKDMLKAENEGDATSCKISSSISYRTEYCNNKFGEDWLANKNCRDESQFCWVCCEQEFGQMHIDARDACYSHCDAQEQSGGAEGGKSGSNSGSWVFIPHAGQ